MTGKEADETRDTLLKGRVILFQSRRGYRHSVDSIILADFIRTAPESEIIDIGTGNGIIPLLLFKTKEFKHVTGVEIQKELATRAGKNVLSNSASEKITIVCSDINDYCPVSEFDIAVSNPPYRKVRCGILNPNPEKAIARHELKLDLCHLFRVAGKMTRKNGRFTIIHLYDRLNDLDRCEKESCFCLERERTVFSREGQPPILILREYAKKSSSSVEKLEPLVIYNPDGSYSNEMDSIYHGRLLS